MSGGGPGEASRGGGPREAGLGGEAANPRDATVAATSGRVAVPGAGASAARPLGRAASPDDPLRLGVLVSGRGSNLQALLDAQRTAGWSARVVVVVSDRAGAPALARAAAAALPARVVPFAAFASRAAFDAELVAVLRAEGVEAVCLAGFMRLVTPVLLDAFPEAVLNVHPALLPAFRGLRAQRQALDHGARITGCTVHLVDAELDHGPIVAQAALAVRDDDDEATLSARLLPLEHATLVGAVRALASGTLRLVGRRVLGARVSSPAAPAPPDRARPSDAPTRAPAAPAPLPAASTRAATSAPAPSAPAPAPGAAPRPVLVSACLTGVGCRYDGGDKRDPRVAAALARLGGVALPVCPEELGGLGTPRPPARLRGGDGAQVLDGTGTVGTADADVTAAFVRGARAAVERALAAGATHAILKERSPSCGVHAVWAGDALSPGRGVAAEALHRAGLTLQSETDLP